MFESIMPVTPEEWLAAVAPLVTLLAGLAFFLAPGLVLRHLGLAGATGEGRSSFAGFPIGLSLAALLLEQPVLNQTIGLAWALAAIGKLVHLGLDGARGVSVMARLVAAVVLAGLALVPEGMPEIGLAVPETMPEWLVAAVAALAVAIGGLALVLPGPVLAALRLRAIEERPAASGEIRGSFAGFHLAAGLAVLVAGGLFLQLALSACWLMTAFGRMISMLSDRGNNLLNWALLLAELILGIVPAAIVFGLIA